MFAAFRKFLSSSTLPETDLVTPEAWLIDLFGAANSAGVKVTAETIFGVSSVFACVNVISRTLSTLPLKLYQRGRDKNGRKTTDELFDHPLACLLDSCPNDDLKMTSVAFRTALQQALSLHGNSYAVIRRDNAGQVRDLWPYHPSTVIVETAGKGKVFRIQGKDQIATYDQSEVIHLYAATLDGVSGVDLPKSLREVFGLAVALEKNAGQFFGNSSRPGMILEYPGILDKKKADEIRAEIEAKHGGLKNAFKTMLLHGGLKFHTNRTPNTDAQFDETCRRQTQQIAAVFGVPAHRIGVNDNIPRANAEELNRLFIDETLRPLCVLWEQALNMMLLSRVERQRGLYFQHDFTGLLRGNLPSRFQAYAQARQWGWFSVNEIREQENLNPIPSGDRYLEPRNMVSVDEVDDPNEPTKLNGHSRLAWNT